MKNRQAELITALQSLTHEREPEPRLAVCERGGQRVDEAGRCSVLYTETSHVVQETAGVDHAPDAGTRPVRIESRACGGPCDVLLVECLNRVVNEPRQESRAQPAREGGVLILAAEERGAVVAVHPGARIEVGTV